MRQVNTELRKRFVAHGDVRVQWPAFRAAVEDLAANAGPLAPTADWLPFRSAVSPDAPLEPQIEGALRRENFEGRYSSLDLMTYAFIGSRQQRSIGEPPTDRYERLMSEWDPLRLWRSNVANSEIAAKLKVGDLGSIFDLTLMHEMSAPYRRPVTRILEVGGGYGRLAECAVNVFSDSVRYVLIDAVPGSLCYAAEYLRKSCPGALIGAYLDGDPFDLATYQCYVIPTWHFRRLNTYRYNVLVSVNSMQEMSQEHVDWYLKLFDDTADIEALVYLNNAHDYTFRGAWKFPAHWQKVLSASTPRSWSGNHPAEVFVARDSTNHGCPNAALDALFRSSIAANDRLASIV
jgi:hypothetical protein